MHSRGRENINGQPRAINVASVAVVFYLLVRMLIPDVAADFQDLSSSLLVQVL